MDTIGTMHAADGTSFRIMTKVFRGERYFEVHERFKNDGERWRFACDRWSVFGAVDYVRERCEQIDAWMAARSA